jgi:hypothetical protein
VASTVGVSVGDTVTLGVGVDGIGVTTPGLGVGAGACPEGVGVGVPFPVGSSRFDSAAIARITPSTASATNPPPR